MLLASSSLQVRAIKMWSMATDLRRQSSPGRSGFFKFAECAEEWTKSQALKINEINTHFIFFFTFLQQPSLQYSLKKKHFSPHRFQTGWVILSSWKSRGGRGRGRQNFSLHALPPARSLFLILPLYLKGTPLPVDTSWTVGSARVFKYSAEERGEIKKPYQ